MGLLDRVAEVRKGSGEEQRYAIDQWINDYLIPAGGQFGYGGNTYPFGLNQTMTGVKVGEVSSTLPGYTQALRGSPPAFAAQMVRALVLSQARFTFRNPPSSFTPRKTFGNRDLSVLEKPWPNGTTGELLARMEWCAGLAGNAYVTNWQPGRLRVLRPDWVGILHGSRLEPEEPGFALDGELIGYVYQNGGFNGANPNPVRNLRVEEVAHWSPLPDPLSAARGMSWITPAIRDIQGDKGYTEHKLKYLENGATPNMVVKGLPAATKQQFDAIVDMLEERHTGVRNAYRTLYLTGGADVTVVGADLKQMDFKSVQGSGETRIAFLSRVPAPILGISEGLAGSSLNAGNFGMARRIFADSWVYPTLQDVARSLAPLVNVPSDAELWFDVADMPLLREDAKDAAEIESIKASTIGGLIKDGFVPETAVAAVMGQNLSLLKHSGLVSVQMQEPGQAAPSSQPPNGQPSNGTPPKPVVPAKASTGKPGA